MLNIKIRFTRNLIKYPVGILINIILRINQYLAKCGFGSRRKVEELILDHKVQLNGVEVESMSTQVDPEKDIVLVEDKTATLKRELEETWMFHKPTGCLCTRTDPKGRPTIFQYLPQLAPPYQSVGRLDQNSQGLLLITRNGDLSHALMHPKYEISKIYEVIAQGIWKKSYIKELENGVVMKEGGIGKAKVLSQNPIDHQKHFLTLELKRGKKREIRYSLASLNLKVISLKRISIDFLQLGELKEGDARPLSNHENNLLNKLIQ